MLGGTSPSAMGGRSASGKVFPPNKDSPQNTVFGVGVIGFDPTLSSEAPQLGGGPGGGLGRGAMDEMPSYGASQVRGKCFERIFSELTRS